MLFPTGQILATRLVLSHLEAHEIAPLELIRRHVTGDFGDLSPADGFENVRAVRQGYRVLSAYRIGDQKVYVITEADRSATTVLLASEY